MDGHVAVRIGRLPPTIELRFAPALRLEADLVRLDRRLLLGEQKGTGGKESWRPDSWVIGG